MAEAWKPVWVHKIDSEIGSVEREREQHHAMVGECDKRLTDLREKRKVWTEAEAADAAASSPSAEYVKSTIGDA